MKVAVSGREVTASFKCTDKNFEMIENDMILLSNRILQSNTSRDILVTPIYNHFMAIIH